MEFCRGQVECMMFTSVEFLMRHVPLCLKLFVVLKWHNEGTLLDGFGYFSEFHFMSCSAPSEFRLQMISFTFSFLFDYIAS